MVEAANWAAVCRHRFFQYLEIFHNRQRRHSRLGMLTPVEYENTFTVA